MQRTRNLNER